MATGMDNSNGPLSFNTVRCFEAGMSAEQMAKELQITVEKARAELERAAGQKLSDLFWWPKHRALVAHTRLLLGDTPDAVAADIDIPLDDLIAHARAIS